MNNNFTHLLLHCGSTTWVRVSPFQFHSDPPPYSQCVRIPLLHSYKQIMDKFSILILWYCGLLHHVVTYTNISENKVPPVRRRHHFPFKKNSGIHWQDYIAQQPRRPQSKLSLLWKPQILQVLDNNLATLHHSWKSERNIWKKMGLDGLLILDFLTILQNTMKTTAYIWNLWM